MRVSLCAVVSSAVFAMAGCAPTNDVEPVGDEGEGERGEGEGEAGEGEGEGEANVCDNIPTFECTLPGANADELEAFCGELVVFDPRQGFGYDDYPINGETSTDQYRSYVRRDVAMLVTYATTRVRCTAEAQGFTFGNNVLGLGDMSEADGSIPGTSDNSPGHPPECHERGYDMDIGYYQLDQPDNRLREVCPHEEGGEEAYHCTGAPTTLDAQRTALFIAYAMESPQYLTIAVDGQVAPLVREAAQELCDTGVLDPASVACSNDGIANGPRNGFGRGISYDPTEAQDIGWFYFHHHHFHLSTFDTKGGYLPNW